MGVTIPYREPTRRGADCADDLGQMTLLELRADAHARDDKLDLTMLAENGSIHSGGAAVELSVGDGISLAPHDAQRLDESHRIGNRRRGHRAESRRDVALPLRLVVVGQKA